jgi:hypothetical protein
MARTLLSNLTDYLDGQSATELFGEAEIPVELEEKLCISVEAGKVKTIFLRL